MMLSRRTRDMSPLWKCFEFKQHVKESGVFYGLGKIPMSIDYIHIEDRMYGFNVRNGYLCTRRCLFTSALGISRST